MMRLLIGLLRRDLTLFIRRPMMSIIPLSFFLLVAMVFAIASGGVPATLRLMASGVIWSAALLANLLSQEAIFRADNENGFIEQVVMSAQPLPLFALAKVIAHWLLAGLPVVCVAPLAATMLNFPLAGLPVLLLTLLLGTVAMSVLTAFGASLTLGQQQPLLTPLLILPLSIPILIFAITATDNAIGHLPVSAPLSLLAAIVVLSLTILPLAMAGVLRSLAGRQ